MSSSVRPIITEGDLGDAGWRELHKLARRRHRNPTKQALALLRYAIYQSLTGHDVELSSGRLDSLLGEQAAA
jgi:hypothetical protein